MNADQQNENQQDSIVLHKLSQEGYALLKEDKCEEALAIFKKMLASEPNNAYALVGIGDTLRKQEKYDEALPYYQQCLDDNPTNSFALFGIADIMRSNEHYEEAISNWKKYLLYDRDNVAVITRIADSYRRINNLQESENHYRSALKIDPKNCYAFIGLGWLYFGAREYEKASEIWLKALQCPRNKSDIRIYTAIGNCYYKMREYEKAIAYYQNGEEKDGKSFFALFGLANCYRGLGRYDKTIAYLERILEFDENNPVVLSRLGDAYVRVSNYQQARALYQKALKVRNDIFAAFGLAKLNYIEGHYAKAVGQLIELLQYKQISTRIHRQLEEYAQDSKLSPEIKKKIAEVL